VTVLLLRLAGPMQAWGDKSRFSRRETRHEPTKSGVLGMLAAAEGRRRTDPVEDLAKTRFGVRVDQPGSLVRDFHTAHDRDGKSMPLSHRYYLSDAVFLVGIEGDPELLAGLHEAVKAPVFPLFLGRRSCPPSGMVTLGIRDGDVDHALRNEAWQAAAWYRRKRPDPTPLDLVRDAADPAEAGELVRDQPVSFDPQRREWGWRTVVRPAPVLVDNPDASRPTSAHDPMSILETS
jgi:CRISPR system Cascade subunit CasD